GPRDLPRRLHERPARGDRAVRPLAGARPPGDGGRRRHAAPRALPLHVRRRGVRDPPRAQRRADRRPRRPAALHVRGRRGAGAEPTPGRAGEKRSRAAQAGPAERRARRRSTDVDHRAGGEAMKISANGIQVNYTLEGPADGPVVTMSHSLATDLSMWDLQAKALARRYRVLRYDTRGHGGTEAPAGAYTLSQLAEDARALLRALGIARTHWIGLSMGGMIGQSLALSSPELLQS